jgi:seryl-tRNA synthetase
MYDINWIKANAEVFDRGLKRRGAAPLSASLLELDGKRREAIVALNDMQERRNRLSKEIGQAKAQKDEAKAQALMAEVATLKEKIPAAEAAERDAKFKLDTELAAIPNLPLDDVPDGPDETANVEYFGRNISREQAAINRAPRPSFSYAPKEHYELGEAMGMMDFEIAAKLSGSRFVVLKSQLARMERALGQFMLDLHTTENGYTEVAPPLLVKEAALHGTAQLPKFENDLFRVLTESYVLRAEARAANGTQLVLGEVLDQLKEIAAELDKEPAPSIIKRQVEKLRQNAAIKQIDFILTEKRLDMEARKVAGDTLYLIPTAEVPLTNLVRESIISEDELPLRFTALTPCFRSEAGSAGRDTRGMLRQHQFNKVEMVSITTPETSIDEHERMLTCAESVLQKLGLHYRVMTLSTGDMGFGAQKTYDLEVWLPGQDTYREISSVSVCGDFQARRMDARVKGKDGKIRHVHTLNGSGTAVGRALIAVMENYQREDGSITVPEALRPYMGGLTSIGARN